MGLRERAGAAGGVARTRDEATSSRRESGSQGDQARRGPAWSVDRCVEFRRGLWRRAQVGLEKPGKISQPPRSGRRGTRGGLPSGLASGPRQRRPSKRPVSLRGPARSRAPGAKRLQVDAKRRVAENAENGLRLFKRCSSAALRFCASYGQADCGAAPLRMRRIRWGQKVGMRGARRVAWGLCESAPDGAGSPGDFVAVAFAFVRNSPYCLEST